MFFSVLCMVCRNYSRLLVKDWILMGFHAVQVIWNFILHTSCGFLYAAVPPFHPKNSNCFIILFYYLYWNGVARKCNCANNNFRHVFHFKWKYIIFFWETIEIEMCGYEWCTCACRKYIWKCTFKFECFESNLKFSVEFKQKPFDLWSFFESTTSVNKSIP